MLFILFLIIHSNFTLTKPRCKYTNISEHTRKIFIFFRFFTLKPHQTTCYSSIIHNQVTCPPLPYQHKHNNLHNHYRPTQRNGATRNSEKNFCIPKPYIVPMYRVERGGIACQQPPPCPPPGSLPPPPASPPPAMIHRRRRCKSQTVQK